MRTVKEIIDALEEISGTMDEEIHDLMLRRASIANVDTSEFRELRALQAGLVDRMTAVDEAIDALKGAIDV